MAGMITRLRLPVRVQDVLLAGFVTLFQVRGTDFVVPDAGMAELAEPVGLGYALLVAGGVVLLVRRRWPVAVFVAVVVISAGYYVLGYPDGNRTHSRQPGDDQAGCARPCPAGGRGLPDRSRQSGAALTARRIRHHATRLDSTAEIKYCPDRFCL